MATLKEQLIERFRAEDIARVEDWANEDHLGGPLKHAATRLAECGSTGAATLRAPSSVGLELSPAWHRDGFVVSIAGQTDEDELFVLVRYSGERDEASIRENATVHPVVECRYCRLTAPTSAVDSGAEFRSQLHSRVPDMDGHPCPGPPRLAKGTTSDL